MGKIINIINKDKYLIFLFLYTGILFFSWNLYHVLSYDGFFLNSIYASPEEAKNIYSWMPLIKGNFTELLFNGDYLPYLTVGFAKLTNIVGGKFLFFFLFNIVFPLSSIILSYLIFKRFIPSIWAIFLSLLLILVFKDYPFRDFLTELFLNQRVINNTNPPEIIFSPIPSFSTFCFLLLFYLSTLSRIISNKKIFIYTILWSLFIYIHPLDWIYGLVFWFGYFIVKLYRKEKKSEKILSKTLFMVLINIILSIAIIYPALADLLNNQISYSALAITDLNLKDNFYYIASYFFLPLLLLSVVTLLYKVDPYEIIINFWQIYLLMLVEIVILISLIFVDYSGLSESLVKYRIVQFFIHGYYFIPPLHFITRKKYFVKSQSNSKIIFSLVILKKIIDSIFIKYKTIVVIPILFLLLLQITILSLENFKNKNSMYNKYHSDINKTLNNIKTEKHHLVTDENIFDLIFISDFNDYGQSILKNRFSSGISENEFLERAIIFAKIKQWTVDEFLLFMMPGSMQKNTKIINFYNNLEFLNSGLGYYFNFHDIILSKDELINYKIKLKDMFVNIDEKNIIDKYIVSYIITNELSNPSNIRVRP